MPDAPRKLFIAPNDIGDLLTERTVEPEDRKYLTGYTRDDIHAAALAENERLREALSAVESRMNQLGGFDGRFTLRKLINAALKPGEP